MTDAVESTATEVESPEPDANGSGREVVVQRPKLLSQRDPVQIAKHFAASGYFQDAREMSQAVVKIVAGEELGFGPMTAMAGIHIIEGKPSLSANLLATLVKRHPRYDYDVATIGTEKAVIKFMRDGEPIGESSFTVQMAKRAGLVRDKSGWAKYPEAMLFARALSQGVRWFCPDVTAGSPAYTPEELGADVNEHGDVVTLPQGAAIPVPERPNGLPAERVDAIEKGLDLVGMTLGSFDLLLGSIGADAMRAKSKKARRERVESLTPEQAEALETELQNLADDDG